MWAVMDMGGGLRIDGGPIYYFENYGSATAGNYPVGSVSWDDCIVWSNALTEFCNYLMGTSYKCVYNSGGGPIRDSRAANYAACHAVVPDARANGFRLLTGDEWELAARYIEDANNDGDITDAGEYYPGNYMSGSSDDYTDTSVSEYFAWFGANSGGASHPVNMLGPNALGLYDMSGNLIEWCEDHFHDEPDRLIRGGCFQDTAEKLQVGFKDDLIDYAQENSGLPIIGFRLAKNK
jgi:formylglycine-generating enzyme